MKVFFLKKVLIVKKSQKVVSCSIFFVLTHTWGIDILLEKLTPETGGWIWETSFLHEYAFVGRDFMESQWPGGKWIDKG